MSNHNSSTIRTQQLLVAVSIALFCIKIFAWYITDSVAILTDALESIVNVTAGFIGLYSIVLSAKPKDKDHPYGHGKVEFIAAAFEGILITIAGFIIIYEAINNLRNPHEIKQLDYGLVLIAISGAINYVVGHICVVKGTKENSPILVAGGNHLKSDTYSTIGLLIGVLLIIFTGFEWIDSLAAMFFAVIIIFTGYKIIRKAISGIMDEADDEIIEEVKNVLIKHREITWIDVHNMRIINYAGFYHIDCHLTIPFYWSIKEGNEIVEKITAILFNHFNERVEFFIHIDPCEPFQCKSCQISNCQFRKDAFTENIEWTNENLVSVHKHENV
jgi:cation diffusion facilitator family transporter